MGQLLENTGGDWDEILENGNTLLHLMCEEDLPETIIRKILKLGANVYFIYLSHYI